MRKKPLIIGSILLHAAVVTTAVVSSAWSIDRLDPAKASVSIAVMLPPPPAPSGSPAGAAIKMTPKPKPVAKGIVQRPEVTIDKLPQVAASGEQGNGQGSGKGDGDNPDGDDDATGTCIGLACGPALSTTKIDLPKVVIPPPEAPKVIPPTILKSLRTSGHTEIVPPDTVKTQILRDAKSKVTGSFQLCLAGNGAIANISTIASTGYPGYDAALYAGMRTWKYQAYEVNGVGTPACSVVTFVYAIR